MERKIGRETVDMVLTAENKLELPRYPAHTAPCSEHNQWFARRSDILSPVHWQRWEFERRCVAALVAAGIGSRKCPSQRRWAYVCVAGASIMALTGKQPMIPENGFGGNAEIILWEALWDAAEKKLELPRYPAHTGPSSEYK